MLITVIIHLLSLIITFSNRCKAFTATAVAFDSRMEPLILNTVINSGEGITHHISHFSDVMRHSLFSGVVRLFPVKLLRFRMRAGAVASVLFWGFFSLKNVL